MIRAAAKNFQNVVVIVDPSRYSQIMGEYKNNGDVRYQKKQERFWLRKPSKKLQDMIWRYTGS